MTQGISPTRSFFRFVLSLLLVVLLTVIIVTTFSFLNFFFLYEKPNLDLLEGKSFEDTAVYENYLHENLWEITTQYDATFIESRESADEPKTLEDLLKPGSTAVALDSPLLTSAGRVDYYQQLQADDVFGARDLDAVIYHEADRIVYSHLPWEDLKPLLKTMNFNSAVSVQNDANGLKVDFFETTNSHLALSQSYWIENLLSRSFLREDILRVLPEYNEWAETHDKLQNDEWMLLNDYSYVFGQSLEEVNYLPSYSSETFTLPRLEEIGIDGVTTGYSPYVSLRFKGFIHLLPNEALRAEPGSVYSLWTEKHDVASRFLTIDMVLILAVAFLGILLLFVYITLQAGLRSDGTYQTALIDRIPHEIILAGIGLIFFAGFSSMEVFIYNLPFPRGWEFNIGAVLVIFFLLATIHTYWLTFIRRLRTKTFVKTSWLLSFLRYLWRKIHLAASRLRRNQARVQILFFILSVTAVFYAALLIGNDPLTALFIVVVGISVYTLYHLNGLGVLRSEVKDLLTYPVDQVEKTSVPPHYSILQEDIYKLAEAQNLAAEEQIRAERLKAELITNVSHDLRTPLTSLVSYTGLLQSNELTEDEKSEYLAIVVEKIKMLRQITENLLDISRVSSGTQAIELEPIDLTEFMRQVWAEYDGIFKEKDLDLILEISGGGQSASFDAYEWARALKKEPMVEPVAPEPVIVLADARSLQRVMLNLFDNALKYALEGSRVFFSLNADDTKAEISLRNISREPLRRRGDELVERFVREESSRTSEGSGLGLAIAQSLSDAMGADFQLRLEDDRFEASLSLERFVERSVDEL